MRKKTFIGLVLAALLAIIVPASALAASSPMSASGVITSISDTYGKAAGNSGNFVVLDRNIYGTFTSGDILGDFAVNYHGNIDMATQSGNIQGTMTSGSYLYNIQGSLDPVIWTQTDTGLIGQAVTTGTWNGPSGKGQGIFRAEVFFVPTPDGHVAAILPGSVFAVSGKW